MLDAKFLSIQGRLSCYQQSRPFESRIPGEALPALIKHTCGPIPGVAIVQLQNKCQLMR